MRWGGGDNILFLKMSILSLSPLYSPEQELGSFTERHFKSSSHLAWQHGVRALPTWNAIHCSLPFFPPCQHALPVTCTTLIKFRDCLQIKFPQTSKLNSSRCQLCSLLAIYDPSPTQKLNFYLLSLLMFIETAPVAKKENEFHTKITSNFDHDLYWNHHPE